LQLDYLRQAIGLRAYAQRDPLNEYKREAFSLFENLLTRLREAVTALLSRVEIQTEAHPNPEESLLPRAPRRTLETHVDPLTGDNELATELSAAARPMPRSARIDPSDPATWGSMPRNAPCPCGSGKKYKHCHGRST
jgi:preprotein translocase subunit SecA